MQSYANRGMKLEKIINSTIEHYRNLNLAFFYKRPVEIVALKTNKNQIINGYFKSISTCDYYGLYQGKYFEFEAKETILTKFAFNNIKKHQWEQLQAVNHHQGISFIIVSFTNKNQSFILPFNKIKSWLNNQQTKQIPFQYFQQFGIALFTDGQEFVNLLDCFSQLISYI